MSRRAFIGVLGVTTIVVAACSSAGPTSHATTGKPLIYEPTTGVTFSDDFNPYDPNSVASSVGMKSIVVRAAGRIRSTRSDRRGHALLAGDRVRLPEWRQGPADHRPHRREVQ